MENEFRDRQRKAATNLRMVRDITMAVLISGMAIVLFFAPRWGLPVDLDNGFRIALGILFAIYGLFRLYRGIKRDY